MQSTNQLVEQYNNEMIALRRKIHENPELSNKEFEATARIKAFLESCGIEIMDTNLKTGCIGILKGNRPGPIVGLREDIDALPIVEKSGVSYASHKEGIMHACGHDIHQTILLYTAKVLSEIKDELQGTVLFIFQPAEEAGDGALQVMDTKFYETFHPDVLLGLHCSPEWNAGTIGLIIMGL